MIRKILVLCITWVATVGLAFGQQGRTDSLVADSVNSSLGRVVEDSLIQLKRAQADSVKQRMQAEIDSLKQVADSLNKASIESGNKEEREQLQAKSDSLKAIADTLTRQADLTYLKANARPVVLESDTLFYTYANLGPYSSEDRASNIEARLMELVKMFAYKSDSLRVFQSEQVWNIAYGQRILISILPEEAQVQKMNGSALAQKYLNTLKPKILSARKKHTIRTWLAEIGWVILILVFVYVLYRLLNILFKFVLKKLYANRERLFKGIKVRSYELLAPHRQLSLAFFAVRIVRLVTLLIILYLTLPLIFSIFPATKGIADTLLSYILNPLQRTFNSIVNYIPHLFEMAIIVICTRYFLKLLHYFSNEITEGKLVINGFYADWAEPTFNIVRTVVYGFMFVLIFPHLPGSDSAAFRGVSVFFGVLFSLGSSSAISNIIAGLVITYMRPFQLNDRVKIGEVVGDVIEKNLLVTRILTIKNEEITIPNSSILGGHTINFTSSKQYLIHSTVTIGYDVPWRQVHEILIDAADDTQYILQDPKPFILQTSLDDFYVSYEVNAYISDTTKIPEAYSEMHQHIQDKFNEAGVEILSPHYRAVRDGGQQTNPPEYLPKDYQSPPIKIKKVDE
ncbi:MAG TPA: transmembrane ion channel [Microscillaceae bacterium]|nr:transmembrane ion channel [Microscillaceae bacterium]